MSKIQAEIRIFIFLHLPTEHIAHLQRIQAHFFILNINDMKRSFLFSKIYMNSWINDIIKLRIVKNQSIQEANLKKRVQGMPRTISRWLIIDMQQQLVWGQEWNHWFENWENFFGLSGTSRAPYWLVPETINGGKLKHHLSLLQKLFRFELCLVLDRGL